MFDSHNLWAWAFYTGSSSAHNLSIQALLLIEYTFLLCPSLSQACASQASLNGGTIMYGISLAVRNVQRLAEAEAEPMLRAALDTKRVAWSTRVQLGPLAKRAAAATMILHHDKHTLLSRVPLNCKTAGGSGFIQVSLHQQQLLPCLHELGSECCSHQALRRMV